MFSKNQDLEKLNPVKWKFVVAYLYLALLFCVLVIQLSMYRNEYRSFDDLNIIRDRTIMDLPPTIIDNAEIFHDTRQLLTFMEIFAETNGIIPLIYTDVGESIPSVVATATASYTLRAIVPDWDNIHFMLHILYTGENNFEVNLISCGAWPILSWRSETVFETAINMAVLGHMSFAESISRAFMYEGLLRDPDDLIFRGVQDEIRRNVIDFLIGITIFLLLGFVYLGKLYKNRRTYKILLSQHETREAEEYLKYNAKTFSEKGKDSLQHTDEADILAEIYKD